MSRTAMVLLASVILVFWSGVSCAELASIVATPTPLPSPTATPDVPKLSSSQAVTLVADRLKGGSKAMVARIGEVDYVGNGRWVVEWGPAHWEVIERDMRAYPLNQIARMREAND